MWLSSPAGVRPSAWCLSSTGGGLYACHASRRAVSFAEIRRPANCKRERVTSRGIGPGPEPWPHANDPAHDQARMTSNLIPSRWGRHSRRGPSSIPSAVPSAMVGGLLLLATASGCPSPDAEGKYDRFIDQTEDDRDVPEMKMDFGAPVLPDFGATGGDTETGGGGLYLDGVYLIAVDTIVSPGLPLQFIGEVTAELDATGTGPITVVFQPLSLEQGSTTVPREEVGDAITIDGEVVEYAFTLSFPEPTNVTGAANPITGSDISANLALEANIRSENAWCGGVTGDVLSPIQVPLEGSTFAAVRLADRSERPLKFACACATVDAEPSAADPDGCVPLPM